MENEISPCQILDITTRQIEKCPIKSDIRIEKYYRGRLKEDKNIKSR